MPVKVVRFEHYTLSRWYQVEALCTMIDYHRRDDAHMLVVRDTRTTYPRQFYNPVRNVTIHTLTRKGD